jgi:hypothetical protein
MRRATKLLLSRLETGHFSKKNVFGQIGQLNNNTLLEMTRE